MERTVWLTDHPGATVEDFDRLRRPFNSVHGGQHRRQHKAYLDWLKDDDEIPPLATGAVMMTATALWTRANAALVVEKQRAKLGMIWDELIISADEAEARAA